MNQNTAEGIVRRATAAFNAGQPDMARALCEQGLTRRPGDPMLHHLLAAVLFSKGEIATAGIHVKTSLTKRPDNAASGRHPGGTQRFVFAAGYFMQLGRRGGLVL